MFHAESLNQKLDHGRSRQRHFFVSGPPVWLFVATRESSFADSVNRATVARTENSVAKTRDWQGMRDMSARLLKERTGEGVDAWNRRIRREPLDDEEALRVWLTKQGVTGYAQSLLVMERFGYPDFLLATADELIDGQYADRAQLRPIFDALIDATAGLGQVTIQARKTYVSLVSPPPTFAPVQATTKNPVDLGLGVERRKPRGAPPASKIQEAMQGQIGL